MKLYKTDIDDEVYYYFLKNGEKRWMYRHKYKDTSGKRREKKKSSFETEKAAYRALLKVKADLLDGHHTKVESDQITVSQWLDIWYETYKGNWKISSRKQRKKIIKDKIKPLLGKYKLSQLDRGTYVREYINVLLEKYQPSSVQLYHRLFNIAINAAVEDEIIPRNRFKKVSIEKDEELDNFLTPEELNIFLHSAKKYVNFTNYTLIYLLAYTGLRRGEAYGLKWEDLNFKEKTLTVRRTRDHFGERTPKTKNSYRTIPIDDMVIKKMESYQKWCIKTKFKYGMKLDKEKDFIFITRLGATPANTNSVPQAFDAIYKYMKKDEINVRRITPHGLRHTHATILINNGVPPKTIADRLGNTVEMIYKVYSHSFKELEDKAVSTFIDVLNGAKPGAK
ncbi:site-specific integrase [Oceanobacillus indicireducens]|uniref:Site-specific integrase n=1 Tax=Oceanobacillus indicireducens TaxID=1004261 RepID=A0A918D214_9BACI|nr:tyrosine-type recombinase/integrase [Oceanobacillus indicireducens]GGN59545.1 site-specific integrase [Oceanobacillus indicireducens]